MQVLIIIIKLATHFKQSRNYTKQTQTVDVHYNYISLTTFQTQKSTTQQKTQKKKTQVMIIEQTYTLFYKQLH